METLIYNGKVYIEAGHFEEALLLSEGIVRKIGSSEALLKEAGPDCHKMDAGGKTVLPGFNDSHLHMGAIGEWLTLLDLSGATSVEEIQKRGRAFLKEHAEMVKDGMFGVGWNQDYFSHEKRMLNRYDLDEISREIPIVLERVCGHIVSANSKALEKIGMGEKVSHMEGGIIETDDEGSATGIFKGTATAMIMKAIPDHSAESLKKMYETAARYAVSVGITSLQSNDVREENSGRIFSLIKELHQEGKLPVRYRHQTSFLSEESLSAFLKTEFISADYDKKKLALGPLKLFKDGSLGARTALLKKEYQDDLGNLGVDYMDKGRMEGLCRLAVEHDLQVITHVIGDGAMKETLDIYERFLSQDQNPLRHGLVHCQITDLPLLERIAKLKVLQFVQPIFLNYDLHVVESRVGKALAETSYAFHTMETLGGPISYGTDAPIEDCNPFANIYAAVTRKDLSGFPEGGFVPEECVSLIQAIDCYTAGSAYAEFQERVKGRLKPGYYADLILLDRDIFTIPEEEIKDVQVDMTMVDGRIVYDRKEGGKK